MSNIRQRLKERKAQIAQLVASTVKSAETASGHLLADVEPQASSAHPTLAATSEPTLVKHLVDDSKPSVKRQKLDDDLDATAADDDDLDWKSDEPIQEDVVSEPVEVTLLPKLIGFCALERLLTYPHRHNPKPHCRNIYRAEKLTTSSKFQR
uniref:Uncharacterized protein n=1 Tax=Plectus sambesii TaxID=2011161 RepID=A0A914UND8_9BILA